MRRVGPRRRAGAKRRRSPFCSPKLRKACSLAILHLQVPRPSMPQHEPSPGCACMHAGLPAGCPRRRRRHRSSAAGPAGAPVLPAAMADHLAFKFKRLGAIKPPSRAAPIPSDGAAEGRRLQGPNSMQQSAGCGLIAPTAIRHECQGSKAARRSSEGAARAHSPPNNTEAARRCTSTHAQHGRLKGRDRGAGGGKLCSGRRPSRTRGLAATSAPTGGSPAQLQGPASSWRPP